MFQIHLLEKILPSVKENLESQGEDSSPPNQANFERAYRTHYLIFLDHLAHDNCNCETEFPL